MNKLESLTDLYQKNVLPYVAHLESKERTSLLKNLETGKENETVLEWKKELELKQVPVAHVVKDYITYVEGLKELDEEDVKKLKNKNTYYLRKHGESLKDNYLKLVVKEETVKVEKEVEKVLTMRDLVKGKKKVHKKEKRKNKNMNRVKKNRKKEK